jgi:hypothetical protein
MVKQSIFYVSFVFAYPFPCKYFPFNRGHTSLVIIPREVVYEDDKTRDGGTAYKQILIESQLKNGKRSKKANWEKLIKEATIRNRLQCHLKKISGPYSTTCIDSNFVF